MNVSYQKRLWMAYAMLLLICTAMFWPARGLDQKLLDAMYFWSKPMSRDAGVNDIVLIGVDEAAFATIAEPFALWHRPLGDLLRSLAQAHPRLIGLDVVLPERSYAFLDTQYDQALTSGLLALKRLSPDTTLVLALTVDQSGKPRPVHPPYLAFAERSGFALWPLDPDRTIRRFDERLAEDGSGIPTFIGEIARSLGHEIKPGWIDFAMGERWGYIPLTEVNEHRNDSAWMQQRFKGKVILIGAVLPFEDRHAVPIPLAAWEDSRAAPGLLLHAQTLRTISAGRLIQPVTGAWLWALALLGTALWWMPGRKLPWIALGAWIIGCVASSMALLRAGYYFPVSLALLSATAAVLGRAMFESLRQWRERLRLQSVFGGYVSPHVLRLLLRGELDWGSARAESKLAFLFADIRDFTVLSARLGAQATVDVLNRYFTVMAEIIHAHEGTIDNFRGDGLMAFFGAPKALPSPTTNASACARAMLMRLDALNRELANENLPSLQIGIGIADGAAVVGHVGGKERYHFTAIGDAVNLAARIQELTKTLGYPILIAHHATHTGAEPDCIDLGEHPLRGLGVARIGGFKSPTEDGIVRTPSEEYSLGTTMRTT